MRVAGSGPRRRPADISFPAHAAAAMPADRRDQSVAALRESELRLRLAVEAARIGIWDWNVLTNEMVWSDEAKAIAGLPLGKPVTFDQISRITHPEDLPRTQSMARSALDPEKRSREPYE